MYCGIDSDQKFRVAPGTYDRLILKSDYNMNRIDYYITKVIVATLHDNVIVVSW